MIFQIFTLFFFCYFCKMKSNSSLFNMMINSQDWFAEFTLYKFQKYGFILFYFFHSHPVLSVFAFLFFHFSSYCLWFAWIFIFLINNKLKKSPLYLKTKKKSQQVVIFYSHFQKSFNEGDWFHWCEITAYCFVGTNKTSHFRRFKNKKFFGKD